MAGSPVNERILLNCWILGYSQLEDIFSINVQPSDDLTDLKQKIKTVNHPIFNGVGIAQLRVYKVSYYEYSIYHYCMVTCFAAFEAYFGRGCRQ